jgi:hypothetical protein
MEMDGLVRKSKFWAELKHFSFDFTLFIVIIVLLIL